MVQKKNRVRFITAKLVGVSLLCALFTNGIFSQAIARESVSKSFSHVDPPSWFIGMPNAKLQLLIHQKAIAENTFSLGGNSDFVHFDGITKLPNPNYILLNISIDKKAEPQVFQIISEGKAGKFKYAYELAQRRPHRRGLDGKDIIYLITPDRFANGDTTNDSYSTMHQVGTNRGEPYDRHGGDIQGIMNHLDYIQDLGMTALWLNPVLENDQPLESYHGYAFTDYYKIDPRFGTNKLYGALADSLHNRNMKLVMDVVFNHIGNEHYLYRDMADSSWFHFWDTFTKSNFRAPVLMDPHASEYDKKRMTNGWFDHHMPDLNQKNEILANYLIQQSLWWIEKYQIDALRIDTYAYPDLAFMQSWAKAVKAAFPDIFLFAETWVHGSTVQAWFMGDALAPEPNYLDGLTDFQLYYAINEALTQKSDWTGGINRLYLALAADYVYPNPENLVTFLDNHDLARAFGYYKGDIRKMKIALTLLYTLRGIPCVYYGTEILMRETDGHGKIREDFLGGWPTDSLNKFLPEGRSTQENEIIGKIQRLATLRKNNPAIYEGRLIQYIPVAGLYVYFRESGANLIMVLVNVSEEQRTVSSSKFDQLLHGKTILENLNGKQIPLGDSLEVAPMKSKVWIVE